MQTPHSGSRNIKCCSSKRHYLIKQLLISKHCDKLLLTIENVFIKPREPIRVDTKSPFSYLYRKVFPSQQTEGHQGRREGDTASFKFPIQFRGHCCEPAIPFLLL